MIIRKSFVQQYIIDTNKTVYFIYILVTAKSTSIIQVRRVRIMCVCVYYEEPALMWYTWHMTHDGNKYYYYHSIRCWTLSAPLLVVWIPNIDHHHEDFVFSYITYSYHNTITAAYIYICIYNGCVFLYSTRIIHTCITCMQSCGYPPVLLRIIRHWWCIAFTAPVCVRVCQFYCHNTYSYTVYGYKITSKHKSLYLLRKVPGTSATSKSVRQSLSYSKWHRFRLHSLNHFLNPCLCCAPRGGSGGHSMAVALYVVIDFKRQPSSLWFFIIEKNILGFGKKEAKNYCDPTALLGCVGAGIDGGTRRAK